MSLSSSSSSISSPSPPSSPPALQLSANNSGRGIVLSGNKNNEAELYLDTVQFMSRPGDDYQKPLVPLLTAEIPGDDSARVRLSGETEQAPMAEIHLPKIHLYIKGSHNLRSVDGSLFCHIIHLYLRAKKTDNNYDLDICLVNTNKIPDEIRKDYTGRLPAIRLSNNTWVDDVDEITRVVEEAYPDPPMATPKTDALIELSSDIMRKFVHYLQFNDPKYLIDELGKLEKFLGEREEKTRFLMADKVRIEDCFMLPKLLQAMIAAKVLRNFALPEDYVNVKQYLTNAIEAAQFIATRPSQAEIVLRWCNKTKQNVSTLMKENPSFAQLANTVTMIGTLALRQKRRQIRSEGGEGGESIEPQVAQPNYASPSSESLPPQRTTLSYSFDEYGGRIVKMRSLPPNN